jgi:hypothetical protein
MPTTATPPKKRTGKGKSRKPPRHSFRPNGKPTKLTEEVWNKILESARSGLPLKYCAQSAGVHADTLEMWRAQNPVLEAELALAQGEAVKDAWARIEQAGLGYEKKPPDWRSDAWRLEKGFPVDFAKPPEVAVTNNVATTTAIAITIIESREIESRSATIDAQVDELFNRRRSAIRDLE